MGVGVYPGSFDPLTRAHVAIAEAAITTCGLERLDLVISTLALAKEGAHAPLASRLAAIERQAARLPALRAASTELQLLADIADGYDVLVLGADKWHQLHDPSFYDSPEHRDAALARLPLLAVAPRAGVAPPDGRDGVLLLDLDPELQVVSSSAVRAGAVDWLA